MPPPSPALSTEAVLASRTHSVVGVDAATVAAAADPIPPPHLALLLPPSDSDPHLDSYADGHLAIYPGTVLYVNRSTGQHFLGTYTST